MSDTTTEEERDAIAEAEREAILEEEEARMRAEQEGDPSGDEDYEENQEPDAPETLGYHAMKAAAKALGVQGLATMKKPELQAAYETALAEKQRIERGESIGHTRNPDGVPVELTGQKETIEVGKAAFAVALTAFNDPNGNAEAGRIVARRSSKTTVKLYQYPEHFEITIPDTFTVEAVRIP